MDDAINALQDLIQAAAEHGGYHIQYDTIRDVWGGLQWLNITITQHNETSF